jgi:acetoin utilization deacetylase AcuC-like enzyme/ribosomal protein S18 acetylase RimI-like enzyme
MLRIHKITDARDPANRALIAEAQSILRTQFPGLDASDIDKLPEQLNDPRRFGFKTELVMVEKGSGTTPAIAVLMFADDLRFAYLDLIAAAPGRGGRGIGAVLYEHVREEARAAGAQGLYFECLPDDPRLSPDVKVRRQNVARLRFYERFGARPIAGTSYETPLKAGDIDPPYLMFDGLDRYDLPAIRQLRRIVRAILQRKYGELCPPSYIAKILRSIRKTSVHLREPRHGALAAPVATQASTALIPLIINEGHDIHHVRERGYVEAPVRVAAMAREFAKVTLFQTIPARHFAERYISDTHAPGLVGYIKRACAEQPAGKSLYPYVFPIRNPDKPPRERSVLAGYWCIDTFTPLNRNVWPAARGAVDCALTAAALVAEGAPAAYALVRPPGHHAEYRAFGGFCYFNNAAIAANYLSQRGRVAVLDIDYHHGNGTQDIFYARADVLTVSVHAHPSFAYPYFSGFATEHGRDAGTGYNLNIPLPEKVSADRYYRAVQRALRRVAKHQPDYLVLAVGFDTASEDPTGTWSNKAEDFHALGALIAAQGWPIAIVQEGGYRVRTLGINARRFFSGVQESLHAVPRTARKALRAAPIANDELTFRTSVTLQDPASVRQLVRDVGNFNAAEVDVAIELVNERLSRGASSGYEFTFAEIAGQVVGYACYGPIPGASARYDLYWVVVRPDGHRRGTGRELVQRVEAVVAARNGERIYIETSSTAAYDAARGFYQRMGYVEAAALPDFYANGDGKLIYCKQLRNSGDTE